MCYRRCLVAMCCLSGIVRRSGYIEHPGSLESAKRKWVGYLHAQGRGFLQAAPNAAHMSQYEASRTMGH